MDYLAAMRSFVRAVELGSFSRAAEEIGLKVSTVSRHVTGLEADLRAAILNRSTRSLHLTEAGQLFFERAVRVLQDVEDARDATRSLNARPQGLLRVALPGAFGRRHVMPHMHAFLEANPDVRLDMTVTDAPVDLIEAGFDVAIRIGAMADSALVGRQLAVERFVLVASSTYLSHRPPPRTPADLARHSCLLSDPHHDCVWHFRDGAGSPAGPPTSVEVMGRMRTNDLEALRDAAIDGEGIALLPVWLCDDELRDERITVVLPRWHWLPPPGSDRAIWGLYPPKKIVSPKVKAFLAFLALRFGRTTGWELAPRGGTASSSGH